ncbi:MAG: TolC family protein [Planctomycetes bacterium]|nr:TolC family protein [Planctomycetota bacterium]
MTSTSRKALTILLAVAANLLCNSIRAEELTEDQVTKRLSELVLNSERQIKSGEQDKALETLSQAKQLAASAKRPEERQIDQRIERLKQLLADSTDKNKAPAAEPAAQPDGDNDVKPTPKPEGPKGILLSLNECTEIALQNNLGLKLSEINDRSVDISLRKAYAKYLPTFTVGYTNSNGDSGVNHSNKSTLTSTVTQNTPWGGSVSLSGNASESHPLGGSARGADVGVTVKQPLWKGAGTDVGLHDIRAAKINKLISRGNLELDVQSLIFNVRQAYANCIRQLQALEVNHNSVDSATTFLRLTKAREAAGQVTKLDVFNSEVQLADRELALTANERALESAFDLLKQLMDVDLEEHIDVEATLFDFGEKAEVGSEKAIEIDEPSGTVVLVTRKNGQPQGDPSVMFQATHYDDKKVLDEAFSSRIELLNSRRNIAIQKLNALLAKDGLGHQVDLTASYTRSGDGQKWSDTFDLPDSNSSIGVQYSIPWGKVSDRAAYEQALLDLQSSEIELKRTRTTVHLDVRDALRTLREIEKSTLIQGKKVEQAKRSVEAAQISFERGLKDSFDVITAQNNLLKAKTDFINSRLDYVVQLALLEKVVGKATGRVDLNAGLPGGMVDTSLPDSLKAKPQPKSAPTAPHAPEDDPFGYEHKKPEAPAKPEAKSEAKTDAKAEAQPEAKK